MQLGLVGLGRMGGNMRERIRAAGHDVVGYDPRPEISDAASLAELVEKLAAPRVVWVMVPSGVTEDIIEQLGGLLSAGDIVIDGGNSKFSDDGPRAEKLGTRGIGYMDVGVSGGVWGISNGYALMVGGDKQHVEHCMPVFDALKPEGEFGFAHAGPVGAGHYSKMVHNGIEYGLMHAYAEGYELLKASELVHNVPEVFKSWREARWSSPGCSTCSTARSTRTPSWPTSRATRRTPARPLDRRGGHSPRGPDERHRRLPVRPLHVPPGRLAGHQGRRRPAQPVRRSRRQEVGPARAGV